MRVVDDLQHSREARDWPDPVDKEFVLASAALLGFSLDKEGNHWRLTSPRIWYLYGSSTGEIQGPWVPETDDEWLHALVRLRQEINLDHSWASGQEIPW